MEGMGWFLAQFISHNVAMVYYHMMEKTQDEKRYIAEGSISKGEQINCSSKLRRFRERYDCVCVCVEGKAGSETNGLLGYLLIP